MMNSRCISRMVGGVSGVALLLTVGCSTPAPRSDIIQEQLDLYQEAFSLDEMPAQPTEEVRVEVEMPLLDALTLALQAHPNLRGHAYELEGAQGRALQEGLWLNPELEVEVENFGGTGEFESFDAAEVTITLAQTFELGGKRHKRVTLAELETGLAEWDYVIAWLDVVAETSKSFADVQAAHSELLLAEADAEISQRIHTAVTERVKAGRDSQLEALKAERLLASAELALSRAEREVRLSMEQLKLMWGQVDVDLRGVAMEQASVSALPSLAQLESLVASFPEMRRMTLEVELAEASLVAARSDRVPDLALAGGYKQSRGDDEQMFVAGAGVELPLFDRNQGGILESGAMLSKAQMEQLMQRKELHSLLVQTYERMQGSTEALALLEERVIPVTRAAFEASEEGYQAGKYTFLDMLDAQRALIESECELVQARLAYVKDQIDVERMIGMPLVVLNARIEQEVGEE